MFLGQGEEVRKYIKQGEMGIQPYGTCVLGSFLSADG